MPGPTIRVWGFASLAFAYAILFLYRYLNYGPVSLTEAVIWGMLVLFTLSLSVEALQEAHGIRRLRAGKGVIACWLVSPSDWQSFTDFDSVRSRRHPNSRSIRRIRSGHPVEVIVGRRGLAVNGRWHKLQGRLDAVFHVAWIDVEPACLEIAILGGGETLSFGVIRVPVPAKAFAAGRRVFDHFKAQIPGTAEPPEFLFGYDRAEGVAEQYRSKGPRSSSSPGNDPGVLLAGAFFAFIGVAIAIVAAHRGNQRLMDPDGADLLVIVGGMTAVFALAVTAVLYVCERRGSA